MIESIRHGLASDVAVEEFSDCSFLNFHNNRPCHESFFHLSYRSLVEFPKQKSFWNLFGIIFFVICLFIIFVPFLILYLFWCCMSWIEPFAIFSFLQFLKDFFNYISTQSLEYNFSSIMILKITQEYCTFLCFVLFVLDTFFWLFLYPKQNRLVNYGVFKQVSTTQ